jgi:hypothetical protein
MPGERRLTSEWGWRSSPRGAGGGRRSGVAARLALGSGRPGPGATRVSHHRDRPARRCDEKLGPESSFSSHGGPNVARGHETRVPDPPATPALNRFRHPRRSTWGRTRGTHMSNTCRHNLSPFTQALAGAPTSRLVVRSVSSFTAGAGWRARAAPERASKGRRDRIPVPGRQCRWDPGAAAPGPRSTIAAASPLARASAVGDRHVADVQPHVRGNSQSRLRSAFVTYSPRPVARP